MVSTKDYLNLSALAYVDFESVDKGKTIGSLADSIKDGNISRKAFDLDSPELSALQDSSNSRQILSDTNFKTVTNLRFTFTSKTTRVLYHAYV